jgi:formylglycine-generating enzyme required for sulfatase activity/serine/threonine protein phosphatase PrpC
MTFQFEISGAQIEGARDYQEDAFLITHLTDKEGKSSSLVIVADGMGGHAAGNVASNMAVQAFNSHFTSNYPSDKIPKILKESIHKANNAITETVKETPALDGMGCTMVSTVFQNGNMWCVSVGDSHLYLLRDGKLVKQNADHSYGGYLDKMAAKGKPVKAEPALSRNMLMSGLTGEEIPDIDSPDTPVELQAGDRIIICSDGLDTLSAGKIIRYSERSETPKQCTDALLKAVDDADVPRQDNATIIVIDVVDIEEEIVLESEEREEPAVPEQLQPAVAAVEKKSIEERPLRPNVGIMLGVLGFVLFAGATFSYFFFNPIPGPVKQTPPTVTPAETIDIEEEQIAEPEIIEPEHPEIAVEPPTPAVAAPESEEPTGEELAMLEPPVKPEPVVDVGKAFRDGFKRGGGFGPDMVPLPGGTFEMGSSTTSVHADEWPKHEVHIKPFAISRYEITIAEYNRFARATGRPTLKGKNRRPATFLYWRNADAYTRWLSKITGENYRLPSEAEWEYAASGRQDTPYWWGFDTEEVEAYCFGCSNGLAPREPTIVGQYKPNQFGLYDTAGNVAEWLADCYHKNYEGAPTDGSVWSDADCEARVARGGSYTSPPLSLRSGNRDRFDPNTTYDFIGLRVARDLN